MNYVKNYFTHFGTNLRSQELSITFLYTAFPFLPKQCDTNPLLAARPGPPVRETHAGASAALRQVKGMGRAFPSAKHSVVPRAAPHHGEHPARPAQRS